MMFHLAHSLIINQAVIAAFESLYELCKYASAGSTVIAAGC